MSTVAFGRSEGGPTSSKAPVRGFWGRSFEVELAGLCRIGFQVHDFPSDLLFEKFGVQDLIGDVWVPFLGTGCSFFGGER